MDTESTLRQPVELPTHPARALRLVAARARTGRLEEDVVRGECIRGAVGLESGATAARAPSCLVRPEPGDRVLVWRTGGECIALAVLERRSAVAPTIGSETGLTLEAPCVSIRAERVHLRAGELLTSARAVHEVSRVSTRSTEVRVAEIGTDIRRAGTACDEVSGTFVQRLGAWVSDTAREARIAARAMLFS